MAPDGLRRLPAGLRAGFRRYDPARILRGARPGDIPIEQPTRFSLGVNLGTAQALGVVLPPAVLAQADEVFGRGVRVSRPRFPFALSRG